ncbi:sugar ABC transporter permease [Bacillaceae bacterium SIJ1]|uniref:carbohydrate ABC transporter permease n=1 Tax=Litoribacterium kuwaitense TaxID=1398745 RepID=UPI0013EB9D34|nr:sugar ABC transporter permease [Litoribacterium kuwaitense]NGP44766.1 sugar ABC transporter permease [Litoribacterium kuwaitense]
MVFNSRLSRLLPILVLLPAMVLYVLFLLFPAFGNIFFSFTDFTGDIRRPLNFVGLRNYERAFGSDFDNLSRIIQNTIVFALLVTIIQNIVAVFLAVLVNMKLVMRNVYRSIIFMPNILGVIVVGIVWVLIFDPYSGPVYRVLESIGIESALLGDPNAALYLVVFVTIWANVGYGMIIYLAGLQSIPTELYEAGRIDGASSWGAFRYITLPLLRPAITINILISIIGTLGMYDIILVLTNGGPGIATTTIGLYILQSLSQYSQGYTAALSIIHFAIVLVVVLITQHYLRRKEAEL